MVELIPSLALFVLGARPDYTVKMIAIWQACLTEMTSDVHEFHAEINKIFSHFWGLGREVWSKKEVTD